MATPASGPGSEVGSVVSSAGSASSHSTKLTRIINQLKTIQDMAKKPVENHEDGGETPMVGHEKNMEKPVPAEAPVAPVPTPARARSTCDSKKVNLVLQQLKAMSETAVVDKPKEPSKDVKKQNPHIVPPYVA